jgi:hypothetical protein
VIKELQDVEIERIHGVSSLCQEFPTRSVG